MRASRGIEQGILLTAEVRILRPRRCLSEFEIPPVYPTVIADQSPRRFSGWTRLSATSCRSLGPVMAIEVLWIDTTHRIDPGLTEPERWLPTIDRDPPGVPSPHEVSSIRST
jgi:hypothetical protein